MNRITRQNIFHTAILCSLVLFIAGCSKQENLKADFQTAINNYNQGHPQCLWSDAKKFPVQAATSDDAKTQGYDALTDAGLLTRTTAEKKVLIIASKQVNNYEISSQGRSDWTADPTQPGYGNFCYGNPDVTSIDNFTTATNSSGQETAQVRYHFKMNHVPEWAKSQEMQTAFPKLTSATAGSQPAQVSLVKMGDTWQVSQSQP
ncbi:MAG: hypothetical protein ABI076_02100 [Acidobacteriaceae bacterium]